jgi:hypothetical protein
MKTYLKSIMAVAALAAVLGSSAFAIPQVSLNSNPYQNGIGGEFTAIPNADALSASGTPDLTPYLNSYAPVARNGGGFQTFCLEYNEHFNWGVNYQYGVSSAAVQGGTGTSDNVSVGTAWLYSQFAQGTLANYFTSGRQANAGLLQNTIWYLEGEIASLSANPFYNSVVGHFGSFAAAQADTSSIDALNADASYYGVWVLNMGSPTSNPPYPNQDQLIYKTPGVPDGGATLLLLGISAGAVSFLRRKLA